MVLVLVLVVMSLVVMMTGAFVMANQANFNSLNATERQREAILALESATEFCTYMLSRNQKWGAQPFSDDAEITPQRGGIEAHQVNGESRIRGKLVGDAVNAHEPAFTVQIINCVDLPGGRDLGDIHVPNDKILLRIVGRSGTFESRADVMLRGEPVFDAALTANRNLMLGDNVGNLTVSSTDRMHNWLRSNGNISLGEIMDGSDKVSLEKQNAGDPAGVLWAKGDIRTRDRGVLRGADIHDAGRKIGGTLAPNSRLHHDIYDLKVSDLKLPRPPDPARMPAGLYRIFNAPFTVMVNGSPERRDVPALLVRPENGGRPTVYYNTRDLPDQNVDLPSGDYHSERVRDHVDLGSTPGGGPAMRYDFSAAKFTTRSNLPVHVNGNLSIVSTVPGLHPDVRLNAEGEKSGVIKADGNINVMGAIEGGGALVSSGNISIKARATLDAQDSEVVLYGKNVSIWAGGKEKMQFKGLIYAQENFRVLGGTQVYIDRDGNDRNGRVEQENNAEPLKHISLEGAVVAREGNIVIESTKNIEVKYNESFLKKLGAELSLDRRRVSRMWTRAY
jgi:hypothetical protein